MYHYTTQEQIRTAFWEEFPDLERLERERKTLSKGHNAKSIDTRCTFNDFLDVLAKHGSISDALADRATL